MKIVKSMLQFCWILFCSSFSISFITWSNIAQPLKSWTILNSQRKGMLKNVQDKNPQCIISREIAYRKGQKNLRDTLYFSVSGRVAVISRIKPNLILIQLIGAELGKNDDHYIVKAVGNTVTVRKRMLTWARDQRYS